jgi:hypothetical protein
MPHPATPIAVRNISFPKKVSAKKPISIILTFSFYSFSSFLSFWLGTLVHRKIFGPLKLRKSFNNNCDRVPLQATPYNSEMSSPPDTQLSDQGRRVLVEALTLDDHKFGSPNADSGTIAPLSLSPNMVEYHIDDVKRHGALFFWGHKQEVI